MGGSPFSSVLVPHQGTLGLKGTLKVLLTYEALWTFVFCVRIWQRELLVLVRFESYWRHVLGLLARLNLYEEGCFLS